MQVRKVLLWIGCLLVMLYALEAWLPPVSAEVGDANDVMTDVSPMRIRYFCMAGQSRRTIPLLTEPREYSLGPGTDLPEGVYFVPHGDTEVTIGVDRGPGVYYGKVELVFLNAVPLANWTGPMMQLTTTVDVEIHAVEESQSAANFLVGSSDIIGLPYP